MKERDRNTIEFLGTWQQLHNLGLKPLEFDRFGARQGCAALRCRPRSLRW